MPSFCLRFRRLVCLFCLFSPLPINRVPLAPKPEAGMAVKAFLSINISMLGDIFPTIFPTLSHSTELTSGERERAPLLCDEAVGKVSFGRWFVDKWGKIDPRKMGEDNGRVRGKIDRLDLEQQ